MARRPWFTVLGAFALGVLFLHAAYYLWIGIDHPALDAYAFRQTQTALSTYWLWREGFHLVYETPVLGSPWAIPYEVPIYQWLVALLRTLGVPIDIGGRLISFFFYIATLYPLWILTRALNLGRSVWLAVAVLYLASPFYVYWSRTIMIESCALFFSVAMLALIASYLNDRRGITLALAFIAGSLAVLTKSTTFPAFAFLAGILVLARGWQERRQGQVSGARVQPFVLALAALATSLAVGVLWVWYTDSIKAENPFGAQLTSVNLAHFNYGSWSQRFSAEFWRDAIWERALPEIFGYAVLLAGVAAAAALQSRRYAGLMLAALAGFLLPFLLFTNLHFVHSYYQNANALLALIAVALGIAAIAELGQPLLAGIVLAVVVAGQLAFFHAKYVPTIEADFTKTPIYLVSQSVREHVREGDALLVLGADWSSEIPYYSERKSLALPSWMPPPLIKQALDDPEKFLGGLKLGGIVYCTMRGYNANSPLVEAAIAGRQVLVEAGPCKLFSPTRQP